MANETNSFKKNSQSKDLKPDKSVLVINKRAAG